MRFPIKTSLRTLLFAWWIAAGSAGAGDAYAQPLGASVASAEWWAAKARVVVRAVVEDVDRLEPSYHCVVTLRVLETLKGEPGEKLQFVSNQSYGSADFNDLQVSGRQGMFFLDDWIRRPHFSRQGGDYVYTRFPLVLESLILLSPDSVEFAHIRLPVYDRDRTPQRSPDMLTNTIRTYLKRSRDGELLVRRVTSLPPELRGGYIDVQFVFPDESPKKETIIDFATFKDRYGREPPAKRKPPYLRTASGYIGIYALELMAADSDVVVRGVVEDWCFVASTTDPTGDTCGVRLRVTESLKGGQRRHVDLVMTDSRDLAKLQASGQEIVVFLRNRALALPAAALGHQTRDTLWDDSVIVLDEREAEVLFDDLTWHNRPAEILKRLRFVIERDDVGNMDIETARLLSQGHMGPPVFNFHPPASIAAGSSIEGNRYSKVYLPVDSQLEANAQRWAKSEHKDLRWLAARAMIYFKSDRNAEILKPLLDDAAAWKRREMFAMLEGTPIKEPKLLVRWEAWHVLNGWGYDVPKPRFK